jgi:hypothetical protein
MSLANAKPSGFVPEPSKLSGLVSTTRTSSNACGTGLCLGCPGCPTYIYKEIKKENHRSSREVKRPEEKKSGSTRKKPRIPGQPGQTAAAQGLPTVRVAQNHPDRPPPQPGQNSPPKYRCAFRTQRPNRPGSQPQPARSQSSGLHVRNGSPDIRVWNIPPDPAGRIGLRRRAWQI